MIRKNDIKVPEGYFAGLDTRLRSIPSRKSERRSRVSTLAPYLAMAACMALAVLVGNFIMSRTVPVDMQYDSLYDGELLSTVLYMPDPDEDPAGDVYEITDEDIVYYLIADKFSVEQLNYYRYEEDD